MSEEVKEGPYTDNGMKLTDFKYQMFGPGIPKGMLHLQLATLSTADQVLLLLNFGYDQGRHSRDAEVAELRDKLTEAVRFLQETSHHVSDDDRLEWDRSACGYSECRPFKEDKR
jgi:hypothetical protein